MYVNYIFEGDDSKNVEQCAINFAKEWDRKDRNPRTQDSHLYLYSKDFATVHLV